MESTYAALACLGTEDIAELDQDNWRLHVQSGDLFLSRKMEGGAVSASFRLLPSGVVRLQSSVMAPGKNHASDRALPAFTREQFWQTLDNLVDQASLATT